MNENDEHAKTIVSDNEKTVIADDTFAAAQSLWQDVVTVESSPDVTIKANLTSVTETIVTNINPGKRRITNPNETVTDDTGIDFKIEDIIGRGGMGVVYSAKQESLNRQIAIKVLDYAKSKNSIDRFLSEAIVTGNLDHPNIIPIYDLGNTDEGKYFYAMKEITGESWDKTISTNSLPHNLRILFDVCDAVAFAHSKNIVHLDIKPENVMLGKFGETLLIDWGIAVILDAKTNSAPNIGKLSGTPAYMAPEMAACKTEKIGIASDIYLLGGTLYEIVTGLKPHAGINIFGTISNAMANIIQSTDKKSKLIDIALKAMATEPEDRYESVIEFQQAIRKYQKQAESILLFEKAEKRFANLKNSKPTDMYLELTEIVVSFQQSLQLWPENAEASAALAKIRIEYIHLALKNEDIKLAESQWEATVKDGKTYKFPEQYNVAITSLRQEIKEAAARAKARKRLIKFSVTVAVIGAIATIIITYAAYFLTCRDRDAAIKAKQNEVIAHKKAINALIAVQNATYFNQIALADNYLTKRNPVHAEELLLATPTRLHGWEWGYLAYQCKKSLLTINSQIKHPGSCTFSPDGKIFAIVNSAQDISIRDSFSGKEISFLQADSSKDISDITFSDNNERLNMATYSGGIRTWNIKTAKEISFIRLENFPEKILATSFSPKGILFACITRQNKVHICSTKTAARINSLSLTPPPPGVNCITITDIGNKIACGGNDSIIRIYNASNGKLLESLTPQTRLAPLVSLAFSPDAKYIASGTADRIMQVWDIKNKLPIQGISAHKHEVSAIAFSRTGNRLISTGSDGIINIFDAHLQSDFLQLQLATSPVNGIAYSPDGQTVTFIAGNKGEVFDVGCWQKKFSLAGHTATITSVNYSPNNKYIVTAGRDKVTIIWNSQSGKMLKILPHTAPVTSARFSPDSNMIITADNSSFYLWDSLSGKQIAKTSGNLGDYKLAAFSPDGKILVTAGNKLDLRNAKDCNKILSSQRLSEQVTCLAFSSDSKLLLTGSQRCATIRDITNGKKVFTLHGNTGAISAVAFSPDNKRAITGSIHTTTIWDVETGKELLAIPHKELWTTAIAFSPDRNFLLIGYGSGKVSIKAALPTDKATSVFDWKRTLYNTWLCHYNLKPDKK